MLSVSLRLFGFQSLVLTYQDALLYAIDSTNIDIRRGSRSVSGGQSAEWAHNPDKDKFPPGFIEAKRNERALRRDQHPEDLVGGTFFLASPDADFMTGQIVNIDGGNNMN